MTRVVSLGALVTFAVAGCGEAVKPPSDSRSGGSGATAGAAGALAGGAGSAAGGAAAEGGSGGATAGNGGSSGSAATAGSGATSAGSAGSAAGSGGDGGVTAAGGSAGAAAAGTGGEAGQGGNGGALRLLAFSRTAVFRHDSIAAGHAALVAIAAERGFEVEASEDVRSISDAVLDQKDVLVFLSTSGDVLDAEAELAFTRFIQRGGGFVGVHAASDTEYDFPFYGGLVGAYFNAHPEIQQATVVVEDADHPATAGLDATWVRTDEWYGFRENPRPNVRVLLTLDESSYAPGASAMGEDHPIAWAHEYEGGRSFYTALGHTVESYSEPAFLAHLAGGIAWAGGLSP